jgi:hypothetical protein
VFDCKLSNLHFVYTAEWSTLMLNATEYIDYFNRSFKIITYCHHNARYSAHRYVYHLDGKCKLNYIDTCFFGSLTETDRKEENYDFASGIKKKDQFRSRRDTEALWN